MLPGVAESWNLPSMSVDVPFVVPLTTTKAPMSGSPSASLTVPLASLGEAAPPVSQPDRKAATSVIRNLKFFLIVSAKSPLVRVRTLQI